MNPPAYPALYVAASNTPHALHDIDAFEVGRDENAHVKVRDLSCSRQQFRIVWVDGRHYVEPYPNTTNPTCLNAQAVCQRTPLQHGDPWSQERTGRWHCIMESGLHPRRRRSKT